MNQISEFNKQRNQRMIIKMETKKKNRSLSCDWGFFKTTE